MLLSFLDRALEPPSYGYQTGGRLITPTRGQILREFAGRLNCASSIKNWLTAWSWLTTLVLAMPLTWFFTAYFSWWLLLAAFLYSMVALGSHGTFWLHRYSTHRAFKFSHPLVRELCRNLVIKLVPEETYVISHHVHHRVSERPGDPYNVHAGWLYCFLADANHQGLSKSLNARDYALVCKLLDHTGVRLNSFAQYQRFGSACHPLKTIAHFALNWTFWFGAFYLTGGLPLACAMFGAAGVWSIGVRTFNYDGHGGGKDKRRAGIDFNRDDLSINQVWPGLVAGEWHNNHHLYPTGARSGFMSYQLDLPWLLISALARVSGVHGVRDYKQDFMDKHWLPYRASLLAATKNGGLDSARAAPAAVKCTLAALSPGKAASALLDPPFANPAPDTSS